MMDYQLVLQFDGALMDDFDALLKLEFELGLGLGKEHAVEGHQLGTGKLSLIIATDCPESALGLSKNIILKQDSKLLGGLVAAFKAADGDAYTVIFPERSKSDDENLENGENREHSSEDFCVL